MNLRTSADCFSYCYRRAGEKESTTRFTDQFTAYLNLAHREILSGSSLLYPDLVATFPWAKSLNPKVINTKASISGTATIVAGSDSVTLSASPSQNILSWHIKFGTNATTYKVVEHTGVSTSITLDGEAVASGSLAFTAFKIEYIIGTDVLRLVSPLQGFIDNANGDSTMQVFGQEEFAFRRAFPLITSGEPTHFAVVSEVDGSVVVRLNKYSSSVRRLECPYIPIPDDLTDSTSEAPLIPLNHRQTMCHLAIYYLFSDKDDTRSAENFQLAQSGYKAMLKSLGYSDIDFSPFPNNTEAKQTLFNNRGQVNA